MHVPARVIRPQSSSSPTTTWVACARVPTRHGPFDTHVFHECGPHGPRSSPSTTGHAGVVEHVALVHGLVEGKEAVPVRVHSECMTSEVFGSLKCDCKEQLDIALAEVVRRGFGVVIYLRQEGRGIGLANKIRAYALQADGHDTVDANRLLGLPDDARRYDAAAGILEHLGVRSVELLTNNPEKVGALSALGVRVAARSGIIVPPTSHSAGYLETKRARMAHDLPAATPSPVPAAVDAAE